MDHVGQRAGVASHAETDGVTPGHKDADDSCEGSRLAGSIEEKRQADTELNRTGDGQRGLRVGGARCVAGELLEGTRSDSHEIAAVVAFDQSLQPVADEADADRESHHG